MPLTATWNPFDQLVRPAEACNVQTPEAYRAWQAAIIAHNRVQRPNRKWRDPFISLVPVTPFVNGGRWGCLCPDCLNFAIYAPDWQLACCGECGAIYANVAPPADADLIESVLLARPALGSRNWNTEATLQVAPPETLVALVAQNVAAGDPVPANVVAAVAAGRFVPDPPTGGVA